VVHNICLIDDQIPLGINTFIEDNKRMNSSNLRLLLSQGETNWAEFQLKELLSKLLEDKTNWNVSAFKHPSFYLTSVDEEYYWADFIIFDWDYGIQKESAEELLKQILKKSFSVITIYTGSDKQEEIKNIVNNDLYEFKSRIEIIIKTDANSPQELITTAQKLYNDNFAFKFSKELRDYNRGSLENILVEFGKPNINDIIYLFGEKEVESNNVSLNVKDVSEMIVDKLKSELVSKNFGDILPQISGDYIPDVTENDLVRQMWSYRLYYNPQDDIIRKGDIIKVKDSGSNLLFLVISSDCHLKHFWKSNFGHLTLIPIHKIHKKNFTLLDKLDLFKGKTDLRKVNGPSSLTNWRELGGGPIVLPCTPVNDEFVDYLLFPKEIFNEEIRVPEKIQVSKRSMSLKYEHFPKYDGKKRITIAEPFITPLVEHILYNISGYGVPDFPNSLQDIITKNFKGIF